MAIINQAVVIVDSNGDPVNFPTVFKELDGLKVGDIDNGNYFEIESDGTDVRYGDATTWDERSQSFVGANIFTVAGRVDYNYTELTLDYAANARYPEEPVGIVIQAPHAWKLGGGVRPHIHWVQNQNAIPNILVSYRVYGNNQDPTGSWTLKALTAENNHYTYPGSGSIQQITELDLAASVFPASLGLSFTFDCKIYRDTGNISTLFAGADAYSGDWSAKYYDIHYEKDTTGSRQEFVK